MLYSTMLLSYVVHGTCPAYSIAFAANLVAWQLFLPDARFRIYIHASARNIPAARLARRVDLPVEIHDFDHDPAPLGRHALTTWRYRPLWEDHDIVLPRDIDSVMGSQETWVLRDFIASSAAFYTIRVFRSAAAIMGGISGFRPARVANFLPRTHDDFLVAEFPGTHHWHHWCDDENFLRHLFDRGGSIMYCSDGVLRRRPRYRHCPMLKCYEDQAWTHAQYPALSRALDRVSEYPGAIVAPGPQDTAEILESCFPGARVVADAMDPRLRDFYLGRRLSAGELRKRR